MAGGPTTAYQYDLNNRLLIETALLGDVETITRYTYDPNGNQIVKIVEVISPEVIGETETLAISLVGQPETTGIVFYQYNGFNRLVKVTDGDTVASYQYNGDGLRTRKEVNGVATVHIWDGNQIAMELSGAGAVTHRYVRGINLIFAQSGATQTFYLFNGHGDVVQLTDAIGTVIKSYVYDAFGIELNPDPSDTNVFRYCGEYFDKETGTIYLRARYYDPVIGRFITEDSYRGGDRDPLSLHLYAYGHSNPVFYADPSGMKVWLIHGTWSDESTWSSNFRAYVGTIFGESYDTLSWSNHNSQPARAGAAAEFVQTIVEWQRANPGEPIRLVGHSHGGNIAIMVANELLLNHRMTTDTLITIGTPVRDEYQITFRGTVGQHINVYSPQDFTQITGGSMLISGRTFKNAENVEIQQPHWVNPLRLWFENHSSMHSNVDIWNKHITPLIHVPSAPAPDSYPRLVAY